MRKQFLSLALIGAILFLIPLYSRAQVATTGPAGLARQMPSIYGPYMANRSRLKNQQRLHHSRVRYASRTRRRHR